MIPKLLLLFTKEHNVRKLLSFRINLIYGTVCEQCTETSCPTMSGGPKFEYLWQDGVKYKKPTHLPAPQVCSIFLKNLRFKLNVF